MNALALRSRLSPRVVVALLALVLVACLIVAFVVTGAAHHVASLHSVIADGGSNIISGRH